VKTPRGEGRRSADVSRSTLPKGFNGALSALTLRVMVKKMGQPGRQHRNMVPAAPQSRAAHEKLGGGLVKVCSTARDPALTMPIALDGNHRLESGNLAFPAPVGFTAKLKGDIIGSSPSIHRCRPRSARRPGAAHAWPIVKCAKRGAAWPLD